MGVAAAFIFPASLAILTSVFPDPSERQKALGIWGATSGIAVAFGPIVGRGPARALLVRLDLPRQRADRHRDPRCRRVPDPALPRWPTPLRHPRHADLDPGRHSLVLAIIEGPQWGWASAGRWRASPPPRSFLTVFRCWSCGSRGRCSTSGSSRSRASPVARSRISVAFFCLFGFIFLITQYFQFVKGYSTLSAGVHTLPFAIVAAVCTPIARWWRSESAHASS